MDLNYKELFALICSGCDREKEVFCPSVLEKSSYIVLNNAKSD